jgi:hypothetical protein
MRIYAVLLAATIAGSGFAACSSYDPGAVTFNPNKRSRDSGVRTDAGDDDDDDGGITGGGDGGGRDTGTVDQGAFTGAPAYKNQLPQNRANQVAAHGGPVSGQQCLTCHVTGGAAANHVFSFAGTVYKDIQGTAPAPQAEVRVVNAQGAQLALVNADQDGNFWYEGPAVAGNSKTAARDGDSLHLMQTAIANGACNAAGGCHAAGNRIYVP